MINQAKVQLSPLEMELVTNANWILTKNNILQKVMDLLGTVQYQQQEYLQISSLHLPAEVIQTSAKISKGEKYQGLPYMILDQPRYFNKENIFAIRHLFWWGNFFSSTLHLAGDYKLQNEQKLIKALDLLKNERLFICINPDPWEHHFEEGNFVPVSSFHNKEPERIILDNPFIKLSRKIPLKDWNSVTKNLFETFRLYVSLLKD